MLTLPTGLFAPEHLLVVLVVALLVLGPEKLPEVAQQVGRGMREFRRAQRHLSAELGDMVTTFDETMPSTTMSLPDEAGAVRDPDTGAAALPLNAARGDRVWPPSPAPPPHHMV